MDDEQRIRERARAIWEREGRPEGCEKKHREQAARELGISVVAGEGQMPSQGGSPITPITGGNAQEEPPYAGVDPNADRNS